MGGGGQKAVGLARHFMVSSQEVSTMALAISFSKTMLPTSSQFYYVNTVATAWTATTADPFRLRYDSVWSACDERIFLLQCQESKLMKLFGDFYYVFLTGDNDITKDRIHGKSICVIIWSILKLIVSFRKTEVAIESF
jgi:hypothetical protein